MTKKIETLVEDIHEVLLKNFPEDLTDAKKKQLAKEFGKRMEDFALNRVLTTYEREPRLSPSNIGKPCERQVWLSINRPEGTEQLQPETYMKFYYGDMIEELVLFLAEAAGHSVTGRQAKVEVEEIHGNKDCNMDGMVADVKSASSFSFQKFAEGKLVEDDPFGYVGQLQTYIEGGQKDPEVTIKDHGAYIVVDKVLGHICVDIHPKAEVDVPEITRGKQKMVASKTCPPRAFEPVPEGKSGNMKLPMQCGYCSEKWTCYEGEGLKGFAYANKPVYLTTIKREPNVPEIVPKLKNG